MIKRDIVLEISAKADIRCKCFLTQTKKVCTEMFNVTRMLQRYSTMSNHFWHLQFKMTQAHS